MASYPETPSDTDATREAAVREVIELYPLFTEFSLYDLATETGMDPAYVNRGIHYYRMAGALEGTPIALVCRNGRYYLSDNPQEVQAYHDGILRRALTSTRTGLAVIRSFATGRSASAKVMRAAVRDSERLIEDLEEALAH